MTVAVALVGEDRASKPIKDVTRSLEGMETQAKQTGGVLSSLTGALGKVGLAGLGIQTAISAVSGMAGVLTAPITAASDLGESLNKVQVVFGDSSKSVEDFAKTAAQNLGQSQAQALAAAGGFGNLFTSMGLGQGAAAKLSTEVVTLGSDLASFNNIDPTEALEKLRAGLVGEAEPLRQLGININADAVEDEALRLGLGKTAKTLTDAAKIQARYSLILKQSKNAQGDFARTSTGMANATRIINASLADLQVEIGNRLLPVIAPLISQIAQALPRAMDALRPILDRAGDAFRSVADTVGRFVSTLREQGLFAALRGLGGEIGTALLNGLRALRDFAGGVVAWLRQQIGSIDWAQVWSAVKNTTAGLLAGFGSIVGGVVAWLRTQWAAIRWADVWSAVTNTAEGLLAGLGSVVGTVVGWLKAQWAAIEWGPIWKSITGLVTGLADGLGQIAGTVTEWVKAQWALIKWEEVWKAVQGHGAALVAALAPITADVEAWLVKQFKAIDWDSVWATAQAGQQASRSLIELIDRTDSSPFGGAIGRFLVRAIKEGIRIATSPGGGFDGAAGLMAAAFVREMVDFPATLLGRLRGYVMRAIRDEVKAAIDEMDPQFFKAALTQKIIDAIKAIYPLQVGPLTLSLSGVSVNTTGITNAARNVVGGGETPTGPPPGAPTGLEPNYQHGGVFRVGGSGGVDSQMVRFRATPGEVVAVGHARGGGGGGSVVLNVSNTFHVANRADADYLGEILPDALARALEKARSQQGLPQATGLVRFA